MNNDIIPVLMAVLCLFLVGGVISFVRNRQPLPAIAVGVGAILAGIAAVLWW